VAPGCYLSLVLFFFALSCLAAATVGSVVVYQRSAQRRLASGAVPDPRLLLTDGGAAPPAERAPAPGPAARSGDPTPLTLQQGDVIVDGGEDWVITGTVTYREEREVWHLHVLDGGSRQRFCEVRQRQGQVEVALLDEARGLPRGQLASGLTHDGQPLTLDVRGDARTAIAGEVGSRSPGQLEYARYSGGGGALLLVEDEGASRRGFFGHRVQASSLMLYSGELNRSA
jgi:hypothetical protein